jgi:hypothetical protein
MANEARDKIYLAALRQEWPFLGWIPEHKFHPERRWRFDFAAPGAMVALEIEGGVWVRGRHSRGAGMIADMHKYNAAVSLGWSVIRVTPQMFEGEWVHLVGWLSRCVGEFGDV